MVTSKLPGGVWPVMLTPFTDGGDVDWDGLDVLTDWYIEQGVMGLFAVCLSSEMFELSARERVAIAERVMRRVDGRIPVVASGGFGESDADKLQSMRDMAATGVRAVVIPLCLLAEEGEADAVWLERAQRLVDGTGSVPLGLYECPVPYHRLLSAEVLRWAVGTGRFVFVKDTSCQTDIILSRLPLLKGEPIQLFDACLPTLLDSMQGGAAGYCSCGANFYPDLFVRLCRLRETDPEAARELHRWLTIVHPAAMQSYPHGAKIFLGLRGLPIGETCRRKTPPLLPKQRATLRALHEEFACRFGSV